MIGKKPLIIYVIKKKLLLVQVLSQEDVNPFYSGRMRLLDSEALDVLDRKICNLELLKGILSL